MTAIVRALVKLIGNPILARFGLAKFFSVFLRLLFCCQISPGVKIGRNIKLAYGGLGIIIHGNTVIGNDVTIGANVVIGGNFGKGGVPKIGDRVFIGPGAKLLGPITIGNDAMIGANAVVLSDVPPRSVAVGVPARNTTRTC